MEEVSSETSPGPVSSWRPVALVADDEATMLSVMRVSLEKMGFLVLAAADGQEALKLSREFPGKIDVLVADLVMPTVDGLSLYQAILKDRPAIGFLLISAYIEAPLPKTPFLRKPFSLDDFKQRVSDILADAA